MCTWHEFRNVIYFNNGTGGFPLTHTYGQSGADTRTVAVADLDGNNTLDIITGNYSGTNYIYFNDGSGKNFTSYPFDVANGGTNIVVVADVDQNGILDVIVGNGEDDNGEDGDHGSMQNVIYATF